MANPLQQGYPRVDPYEGNQRYNARYGNSQVFSNIGGDYGADQNQINSVLNQLSDVEDQKYINQRQQLEKQGLNDSQIGQFRNAKDKYYDTSRNEDWFAPYLLKQSFQNVGNKPVGVSSGVKLVGSAMQQFYKSLPPPKLSKQEANFLRFATPEQRQLFFQNKGIQDSDNYKLNNPQDPLSGYKYWNRCGNAIATNFKDVQSLDELVNFYQAAVDNVGLITLSREMKDIISLIPKEIGQAFLEQMETGGNIVVVPKAKRRTTKKVVQPQFYTETEESGNENQPRQPVSPESIQTGVNAYQQQATPQYPVSELQSNPLSSLYSEGSLLLNYPSVPSPVTTTVAPEITISEKAAENYNEVVKRGTQILNTLQNMQTTPQGEQMAQLNLNELSETNEELAQKLRAALNNILSIQDIFFSEAVKKTVASGQRKSAREQKADEFVLGRVESQKDEFVKDGNALVNQWERDFLQSISKNVFVDQLITAYNTRIKENPQRYLNPETDKNYKGQDVREWGVAQENLGFIRGLKTAENSIIKTFAENPPFPEDAGIQIYDNVVIPPLKE